MKIMKSYRLQLTGVEVAIPSLVTELIEAGRYALASIQSDPETAIHDFRRFMKMARAALKLGRSAMDTGDFTVVNCLLRDAQGYVSGHRDEDALVEICAWARKKQRKPVARLLEQVEEHLRVRKISLSTQVIGVAGDALTLTAQAIDLLRNPRFHTVFPPEKVIAEGIRRGYAAGRRHFRKAFAGAVPQEIWHAWRKRAKDTRYQVTFVSSLWPAYFRTWEEELHHLTDFLGRQRDLFLLVERLQQPETSLPDATPEAITTLLEALETTRLDQARKALALGRKIYLEPPGWWGRRVKKLWRARDNQDNHEHDG